VYLIIDEPKGGLGGRFMVPHDIGSAAEAEARLQE
jgi:hypothetical protein